MIIVKIGYTTFYVDENGKISRNRPWWQWREIWNTYKMMNTI